MAAPSSSSSQRRLRTSEHVTAFEHLGEVYLYHDLYGYVLQMSPDVLGLLEAFREPAPVERVCAEFAEAFGEEPPEPFIGIFEDFGCLVPPEDDETEALWEQIPVRSRWNVWERNDDGGIVLYTAWGDGPVGRHPLTPAEAAVWDDVDGETRVAELARRHGEALGGSDRVLELVRRLVHHDAQALKLSTRPESAFGGEGAERPPYLDSSMPYRRHDPRRDPEPAPPLDALREGSHQRGEPAAGEEEVPSTLAELLGGSHPALGGRSYGEALASGLAQRELLPEGSLRVLALGSGSTRVARNMARGLEAGGRHVEGDAVAPASIEPSPDRAAGDDAAPGDAEGSALAFRAGDPLEDPWPREAYELIVVDELLGALPASRLTHAEAGLDREDPEHDAIRDRLGELGEAGETLNRWGIPVTEAPDPFYVHTGAIRLVERIAHALAPGGVAVLTEFGGLNNWPVLSGRGERPELSMHFGHLALVAQQLGLHVQLPTLIDLIGLDRDAEGLATSRSQFRALRDLLAGHGVELDRVGYTREMLEELLEGRIDRSRIGGLSFEPIDERLMGVAPHGLKALILRREAD